MGGGMAEEQCDSQQEFLAGVEYAGAPAKCP